MTNIEKWLVDNGYQEIERYDERFWVSYQKGDFEVEVHFKGKNFIIFLFNWRFCDPVRSEADAEYLRKIIRLWDGLNAVKDPWEEAK